MHQRISEIISQSTAGLKVSHSRRTQRQAGQEVSHSLSSQTQLRLKRYKSEIYTDIPSYFKILYMMKHTVLLLNLCDRYPITIHLSEIFKSSSKSKSSFSSTMVALRFSFFFCLGQVIGAGEHLINGKKIDPKKAKARTGKVFVGGLIQEISDDDIKNYFSQFGNVSLLLS